MRLCIGTIVVVLALMLTGCGSSDGYASKAGSAIDTMKSAISTYNNTSPRDVRSTGGACSTALDKLKGSSMPSPSAAPKNQKQLGVALQQGYAEAKLGFRNCATAGNRNDYVLMAQAVQEIDQANARLQRARALDH